MNKVIVAMLSLSLALMLVPIAITNPDISTYDPMADVNRDGIVDANDLSRLGQAYGSTQSVPTQSNQTVVYVYQLETHPTEVENARVAIIDPKYDYQAVRVGYTNSSGVVSFTLSPSSNYTAIAWSKTTHNYANFTTNSFGEASVAIQLVYPQLPPHWVTITLLNASSGGFWFEAGAYAAVLELVWTYVPEVHRYFYNWTRVWECLVEPFNGVLIIFGQKASEPGKPYWVAIIEETGDSLGEYAYTPDENGNANVVAYID